MAQIAFMFNEKLSLLGRLALIKSIKKSLRTIMLLRHIGFGSGLFVRMKSNLVQQDKIIFIVILM